MFTGSKETDNYRATFYATGYLFGIYAPGDKSNRHYSS